MFDVLITALCVYLFGAVFFYELGLAYFRASNGRAINIELIRFGARAWPIVLIFWLYVAIDSLARAGFRTLADWLK